MGCLDPCAPLLPTIVRGSAIKLPVALPVDQFTGQPVDISTASEISFTLKNADGTVVTKTKTGAAITDRGYIQGDFFVQLLEADTATLLLSAADTVGDIDARVTFVISGKTYIVNLVDYCTVVDKVFPGL